MPHTKERNGMGDHVSMPEFSTDAFPHLITSHLLVSTDHSWAPRTDETFLVPSLHGPLEQLWRLAGPSVDSPATSTPASAEHPPFSGKTSTSGSVGDASEKQSSTIVWQFK
jgi:hypothetical protein